MYAEELLAAGPDSLPEALSDLLLRRVDGLGEQARVVLRMASAYGSRLSPQLLGEALGLDEAAVDASHPSASASLRVAIALFAFIAAFLLVTGTGFAMGTFQGYGHDSTLQLRPPPTTPGQQP